MISIRPLLGCQPLSQGGVVGLGQAAVGVDLAGEVKEVRHVLALVPDRNGQAPLPEIREQDQSPARRDPGLRQRGRPPPLPAPRHTGDRVGLGARRAPLQRLACPSPRASASCILVVVSAGCQVCAFLGRKRDMDANTPSTTHRTPPATRAQGNGSESDQTAGTTTTTTAKEENGKQQAVLVALGAPWRAGRCRDRLGHRLPDRRLVRLPDSTGHGRGRGPDRTLRGPCRALLARKLERARCSRCDIHGRPGRHTRALQWIRVAHVDPGPSHRRTGRLYRIPWHRLRTLRPDQSDCRHDPEKGCSKGGATRLSTADDDRLGSPCRWLIVAEADLHRLRLDCRA